MTGGKPYEMASGSARYEMDGVTGDGWTCGKCGAETAVIGYEESERLDVEPAKFFVTVTRREKRACRSCKQSGVATAPVAAEIVEKGLEIGRAHV
mgnify:CR=1 FL=1